MSSWLSRALRLVLIVSAACATSTPDVVSADRATGGAPAGRAVRDKVRAYRSAHEDAILREFVDLLAIPNVAADPPNVRRSAEAIVRMMASRGIEGRLLEADGAAPAVYGEVKTPGARKTLIAYAHYDGQPVDPSEWRGAPFKPVLRDGPLGPNSRDVPLPRPGERANPEHRLFARGASDDKGGVVAILDALAALKATGLAPSVNVKLFFEGEEEQGSPHLAAILAKHAALLKADGLLFIDGPAYPNGSPVLSLGVRGVQVLELTTYGPDRSLHSGHYGNWVPNAIVELTHLVDSMRDTDGTIRIDGFGATVRPPSPGERALLSRAPNVDALLKADLAIGASEGHGEPISERVLLPALNLRGFQAGHVGAQAANALPTEARASIDFRLVPDQTPEKVRALVDAHIRAQGFFIVDSEPDRATRAAHQRVVKVDWRPGGYPASRTPVDAPLAQAVVRILDDASTGAVVLPTSGGSLPTYVFERALKVPLLFLSGANYDNHQHAANEDIRLQNLWDMIETDATLFAELGRTWK
jgi:acetylornithine deacetylase/succinyl-diaminopimelate desuccinylase-like protein